LDCREIEEEKAKREEGFGMALVVVIGSRGEMSRLLCSYSRTRIGYRGGNREREREREGKRNLTCA